PAVGGGALALGRGLAALSRPANRNGGDVGVDAGDENGGTEGDRGSNVQAAGDAERTQSLNIVTESVNHFPGLCHHANCAGVDVNNRRSGDAQIWSDVGASRFA